MKFSSNNSLFKPNNLSGELRYVFSNKINFFLSDNILICSSLLKILASSFLVEFLTTDVITIKVDINMIINKFCINFIIFFSSYSPQFS